MFSKLSKSKRSVRYSRLKTEGDSEDERLEKEMEERWREKLRKAEMERIVEEAVRKREEELMREKKTDNLMKFD